MDYSKSGNAKFGKGIPRHLEKNAKAPEGNGGRETKEQLFGPYESRSLGKGRKESRLALVLTQLCHKPVTSGRHR